MKTRARIEKNIKPLMLSANYLQEHEILKLYVSYWIQLLYGFSKVMSDIILMRTGRLSLRAKRGNLDFGQWRLLRRSAPRNDIVRHLSQRMRKSSQSDRIFENRYSQVYLKPLLKSAKHPACACASLKQLVCHMVFGKSNIAT
jgi:hypothetical protein